MIRWPRDPLIFSVRVRGCGVYAAGYVEGDTSSLEILAARTTTQGLELVSLRGVRDSGDLLKHEIAAARAFGDRDGVARVLDVFMPEGSLQPMSSSSLGESHRVVVAERLPGDVNLADLSRLLFRRRNDPSGQPPVGLALFVVRELAHIYEVTRPVALPGDDFAALHLGRRADCVLLAWDGSVHVQPRAVAVRLRDFGERNNPVVACGHHLLRLLTAEAIDANPYHDDDYGRLIYDMGERALDMPSHIPSAVQELVKACVKRPTSMTPKQVVARLDELLIDEPFSRDDLAGTLAQLFADERAQDLAFREELGTCDLDALTLPEVRAAEFG